MFVCISITFADNCTHRPGFVSQSHNSFCVQLILVTIALEFEIFKDVYKEEIELQPGHGFPRTFSLSYLENKIGNKSGVFKKTHQAPANRWSLFSRMVSVVARISLFL